MTIGEVMAELERLGTAQNRKVYARHGVRGPMFGVSFGNLRELQKKVKRDHALAGALWRTQNHDARVFATLIADPAAAAPAQLDGWAEDLDNSVLADALATFVRRSPDAVAAMERWTASSDEWVARAGWALLAHLAQERPELEQERLEAKIEQIEEGIHGAANFARHAMNAALIAVGGRSEALREKAVAAARRIGKVEVDHGDTGCKTPDAVAYIDAIWARRGEGSGRA